MKLIGAVIVLLLLAAVVGSAIGVVYARQQDRILFGELTRLTHEQDDLNTEFGRLDSIALKPVTEMAADYRSLYDQVLETTTRGVYAGRALATQNGAHR